MTKRRRGAQDRQMVTRTELEIIQPDAFIAHASIECMTELQLGQLAASQSEVEPVRQFAHQLVQDYEKASSDIARIAARRKLPVPEALDEEHAREVELLREKNGREFDSAYTMRILDNYQKTILLFKRGQRIKDPEISALASRALSMLETRMRKTTSLLENLQP
jgi:putative membrane protein